MPKLSAHFIILFMLILFFYNYNSHCIEVSGYLSENTIWSPENNPYIVTDNIFVNSGVTLRILPGTRIELAAAHQDNIADFLFMNGENVAKFIKVNGIWKTIILKTILR